MDPIPGVEAIVLDATDPAGLSLEYSSASLAYSYNWET